MEMKVTREFNHKPLYVAFQDTGMTQKALADELEINYFELNRILHGKRGPNERILNKLCARLNVPMEACVG